MGRSHVARALVAAGHAEDVADAFKRLIGRGRPFYVAKDVRSPQDAIACIRDAGGLAVVAHPGITRIDSLMPDLVTAGLSGIEAYHADHTQKDRARYAGIPGLRFEQADATALDAYPDASFDLVLSFETLEHVHAQERLLDGFARLLAPGGLLLVSTPDKRTYTDLTGEVNPHHVRELYRDEFEALLAARFPARRLYGQKNLFQSVLWALDGQGGGAQAHALQPDGAVVDGVGPAPMYYLAACARDGAALASLPALSLFGDTLESVYADYRAEIARNRAAAAHIAHLEAELARLRGGA